MSGRIVALCLAALLAAGCVGGEQAGPAPQQAHRAEQPISVRIETWGRLHAAWEIHPDGSGLYRSAVGVGGSFGDYDIVTRRFAGGREAYLAVAGLLEPAKVYSGKEVPCGKSVTDAPYGHIAWGAPPVRKVDFNYGCLGKTAAGVTRRVESAQRTVSALASGAPETGREQVRSGN